MARKSLMLGAIGTALAAAALSAVPAQAQYYGDGGGYYQQVGHGWHGDRDYRGYRGGDYGRRGWDGNRGRGYYDTSYYGGGRGYYGGRHRYRCDRGDGGTVIGAIAGGLLGNSIAGRGDRTVGAILGAGVGAVAGRAIDRDC